MHPDIIAPRIIETHKPLIHVKVVSLQKEKKTNLLCVQCDQTMKWILKLVSVKNVINKAEVAAGTFVPK